MKIDFIKLRENASVPARATPMSAGYDLCAAIDAPIVIPPGERKMIPIGIAAAPERCDIGLFVFPRSGLSVKYGITLPNCVGVIDPDYRGEIMVPLINYGSETFTFETGMRIAQLVALPVLTQEWRLTENLSSTERGTGGFGSSGINK